MNRYGITPFVPFIQISTPLTNSNKPLLQISFVYREDPMKIPGDYKGVADHFASLLHNATVEKPIYIFLDAVDQLFPDDGASGMSWLPISLPPNVKITLSTSSDVQYRCYPVLQSLLAKQQKSFVEVSSFCDSWQNSMNCFGAHLKYILYSHVHLPCPIDAK